MSPLSSSHLQHGLLYGKVAEVNTSMVWSKEQGSVQGHICTKFEDGANRRLDLLEPRFPSFDHGTGEMHVDFPT